MLKIKISLVLDDNEELDYITREIPSFHKYNVAYGLINDLNSILRRNTKSDGISLPYYLFHEFSRIKFVTIKEDKSSF